jgi:lysophospholipase L1-like esterase
MKLPAVWLAALVLLAFVSSAAADEKQIKVLMLGDSVTARGMPQAVEAPLNDLSKGQLKWTVVNGGAGGDTADGGAERIGPLLEKHHPDLVTISFGLNDIGKTSTPEAFKANLLKIIAVINKQAPQTKIVLLTATPFNIAVHDIGKNAALNAQGGADLVMDMKYNLATRQLAAEKQLPIIDLHRLFLTDPAWATKFINARDQIYPDGVHLSREGYACAGPHVAAALHAWCQAEILKTPAAVALRDQAVARLKKAAETAPKAADPKVRQDLLVELDKVWRACPWLPTQALLWHTVYYAGLKPQPVNPQPDSSTPAKP